MSNPFVHVELLSTDVGKSRGFYQKLFDWKFEDMPFGQDTYTMIRVGEGTGGGLVRNPIPGAGSEWVAYVKVDDVRKMTGRATSLGAAVVVDATEIKGAGSFSVIKDPTGATLGLWQPKGGS